ncbi:hypothetical protein M3I54_39410 [Paraburkholderia sp. CNPSo 3274]|uniref:hypothetical protein n=1 Tax=Paraburkholderia sp. CNPSo 3274 TaxID=2940932 RepID=UPI0020B7EB2C|nr:hypothetical protein [Paraburkholderia sp. CNPSo 3274]MCP3712897.1 hypothetical protein [Paraburkholderia sp. CNPSo 3274]
MKRFAEYEGWTIEASPTVLAKQRLFVTGVVVSRGDERFVFHDLGNFVYRDQSTIAPSRGPKSGLTTTIGRGHLTTTNREINAS